MLYLLRTCYRIRPLSQLAKGKVKTRESQIYLLLDACGVLTPAHDSRDFFLQVVVVAQNISPLTAQPNLCFPPMIWPCACLNLILLLCRVNVWYKCIIS